MRNNNIIGMSHSVFKLLSLLFLVYLAPMQLSAQVCGDQVVNKPVCSNTNFAELTPDMVGITATSNNLSISNYDVSSSFGLPQGSVKVSFNSVDVIDKNGVLAFYLAGDGDNEASWTINYSLEKYLQVAHGGALAGNELDKFTSNDANRYTFNTSLDNGFTHNANSGSYSVKNNTDSKIINSSDFVWTSNAGSKLFKFDVTTTARSRAGKGSRYTIYIDDSSCTASTNEQCDDGNTNNGDGCSGSCQVEANYVCNRDTNNDMICDTAGAGSVVPVQNSCGDGKINGLECQNTHFSELTPSMLGITGTQNNISMNNVDVSQHYGLPAGSIKVSLSSVDVINKNGVMAFFLAGDGDTTGSWHITYATDKAIKVSHGGALASQKDDIFISEDSQSYTFNGGLENGLSHSKSGSNYKVHNASASKIFNATDFEWRANSTAKSFQFRVETNADSASGKGSKYRIFVDDAKCTELSSELCDDGNQDNGDGCSDTCQVEIGFVCKEDAQTASWEEMNSYNKTCNDVGLGSVSIWTRT